MKAYLMYADRDFELLPPPRPEVHDPTADLIQDLELPTLWEGMCGGDEFMRSVARSALLSGLASVEEIRFRQRVLADCLAHADVVRELYDLSCSAIAGERSIFRGFFTAHGEAALRRSVEVIQMFLGMLRRLRQLAEEHGDEFTSDGFRRFFGELCAELDDAYFEEVESHLKALRFRDGIVMSARLGPGNRGTGYVLRSPRAENRGAWFNRTLLRKPVFSFSIPDRDDAGFRALSELRDRGVNLVADAVGESADHILSFFVALRTELGFYVAALNLYALLAAGAGSVTFPDPIAAGELRLGARDLYDPCLSLRLGSRAVGNSLDADGKDLIVVTGANQGGKSTFMRSLGLAHLMMQAGLFVTAESFTSTVTSGVFTHYRREEDATMSAGKFDEELSRMSGIAEQITPGCLLICNESFAATNEREGSDIAEEVVRAMTDSGVRVVFVTHMYDLSRRYEQDHVAQTLFLRADRGEGGNRTFQLVEAAPLPTSFGADIYRRTFGAAASGPQPVGRPR